MLDASVFGHLWTPEGWTFLAYQFGPSALRAVFVVVVTILATRLVRSSFDFATRRTGADASARLLIGRIAQIVVVGIGAATFLDTLGVPLTTFVTVIGVAGLGISLAMQDILKSFVAGTYLLFERPFRIGDEISVKDQRGIVEHVGIRTTLLRNADNVQIVIPNSVMFAELVLNRTNERKPEPEPEAPEPTVDASSDDGPLPADHPAPAATNGPAVAPGSPAPTEVRR